MKIRSFFLAVCFLFLAAAGSVTAQSITSSGIGGIVRSVDGDLANNVSVTAIHTPSGTRSTSITNAEGRYTLRGLRVGGPYTISFVAPNGDEAEVTGINVNLQQQRTVNAQLRTSGVVFELEAMVVTANELGSIFNENKQGSSSIIDSGEISRIPTVSRSLTDIVRLDPRMSTFDEDSGTISAAGKNTRYNSLLIDGVPTNDSFGLSESGLPALKQPFSLEAISEVSVQISPYTVENAGFTGASVSAVTKSGNNTFSGSFFGFYRDESMIGELEDERIVNENKTVIPEEQEDPVVPIADFREYTLGFTVSGPIIRDRLFFFALYETVEETEARDPGDWFPTDEQLGRIDTMINDVYEFDAGDIVEPDSLTRVDDKYLLKLDWNISDKHRLTGRYQLTEGEDPSYPNTGFNSVAYTSHNFIENFQLNDYVLELFSNWSPTLQTEVLLSHKVYDQFRALTENPLPEIQISAVDGIDGDPGSVWLGTEGNSQANDLNVETTTFRSKVSWLLGDHSIKAGVQYENFANRNEFISNRFGRYFFRDGVRAFENAVEPGRFENYQLTLPAEGQTGIADWSMAIASAFIEDNWKVTADFNLNFGVRIDYPIMDDVPTKARASSAGEFEEIFGYTNQTTLDGNYVIQPRVGFNYAFDEDRNLQVRGGAGLFFGSAPHVWISSMYVNNGNSQESYFVRGRDTPAFTPDPFNQPVPESTNPRVNVDFIDEDFEMPSEWKTNLALDYRLFEHTAFTVEVAYSWTNKDIHYVHENLNPQANFFTGSTQIADGRTFYNNNLPRSREPGYQDVIRLTNTDKGYSRQFTTLIQRPVIDNWGYRVGYTYTRAKNVSDGQSNSAFGNWTNNVGFDPNSEVLGRSRYETTHRLVASATYEIDWSDRHKTAITLIYEGRSGRPFSFVMGDGGPIDINNDGNTSNDLFYVPSGVDDPKIIWSGENALENAALFMQRIDEIDGLSQHKGSVVPRNTGNAPWIHQFDLNITHEIGMFGDDRLELIFTIENIGNLINETWGLERRVAGSGGNVPVVDVKNASVRVDGEWETKFEYFANPDLLSTDEWYQTRTLSSRWAIQLGIRYTY